MAHHPLYPVARRLVGRHVHVYHMNGRIYPGYLQSVTPDGIYLIRTDGYAGVSANADDTDFSTLVGGQNNTKMTQVYAPAAFFGFGALTGLTLGALAARPYGYGYGYGYGYPYYW
ncbi:hypothetical protein [Alicyclobacillus suci]|uniref:hypothetical protein n=1 Tax=Alicyclobacillus suci TaxID=2816080 RepID=UPI001A8FAA74|nr:hypothetical protein [Alicyclobacillus suci]